MEERNCSLELRLSPVTVESDSDQPQKHPSLAESSRSTAQEQQQQQQLAISSINGRMGVSDVSELQGRAIISLATREIGEKVKTNLISSSSSRCNESTSTAFSSFSTSSPSKLSMKISLQRFLQKRNCRIQAISPYHHHSNQ